MKNKQKQSVSNHIWYFCVEYNRSQNRSLFRRVYAQLELMDSHKMVISVKGERFLIESDYLISEMLIPGTHVLMGFIHTPKGEKYGRLYPLPDVAEYTDHVTQLHFPEFNLLSVIYSDPQVIQAQSEYNRTMDELRANFLMRENVAQYEINVARTLSVKSKIKELLDDGRDVVEKIKPYAKNGKEIGRKFQDLQEKLQDSDTENESRGNQDSESSEWGIEGRSLECGSKEYSEDAFRILDDPSASKVDMAKAMKYLLSKVRNGSKSSKKKATNLKNVKKFFQ